MSGGAWLAGSQILHYSPYFITHDLSIYVGSHPGLTSQNAVLGIPESRLISVISYNGVKGLGFTARCRQPRQGRPRAGRGRV